MLRQNYLAMPAPLRLHPLLLRQRQPHQHLRFQLLPHRHLYRLPLR